MLELSSRLERTRIAFLVVAILAAVALLYQGKTGGELVYEQGVGVSMSRSQARSTQTRRRGLVEVTRKGSSFTTDQKTA